MWDAKYGATHSTTHLTKYLRRKHFDLYKAMLKKKVNDAVVETEDNSRSCTSLTNSSQRKQPPPSAPDGLYDQEGHLVAAKTRGDVFDSNLKLGY